MGKKDIGEEKERGIEEEKYLKNFIFGREASFFEKLRQNFGSKPSFFWLTSTVLL